uniref:PNPLA domain-containing protein n=2 Tax=Caenorhabditis japonica TaxID=281687 RepID=A0A8R1DYT5_CAEJA
MTDSHRIDASVETLYAMADEVNSKPFGAMTPGYYLNEELVKTWENVIISRFDSREHLIKCLLASCYIPMYSMGYRGLPPIINDEECIDGGMTNNLPTFSDIRTITCSPFSSQADICPEDLSTRNVTFANQNFKASSENLYRGARALFPPSRNILKQYYQMGHDDAERFIQRNIIT